ncbi:MAG: RNA 2',3'-cyclic phosphodiesterase [Candidatus Nanoarchaeia archaeon]
MRAFIAIELPQELRNKISNFILNLKKRNIIDAKFVRTEQLHLTLKFLGEVQEQNIDKIKAVLEKIVSETKKFELQLKGLGHFNYRVLWIGGGSGQFETSKLASQLDAELSKLGFKEEQRPYTIHLTLARVKALKDRSAFQKLLLRYAAENFGAFVIDKVKLIKSVLTRTGPQYETIAEYRLQE